MIRTPLRPLARILSARANGIDPDKIEAEERAARLRARQKAERLRTERRLWLLAATFVMAFGTVAGRMAVLAASEPVEPEAGYREAHIANQRADITDRQGRILATNLKTHSLYAQPHKMIDPRAAADGLVRIFPELDHARLVKDFTGARKFVWIKRTLSPEQRQAVHDLGEPGLNFGPREMRLYPNGAIAAHVLGGYRFGQEGAHAAEVIGTAGLELTFDAYLRDPAEAGQPLVTTIDLSVQAAVERVLEGGMALMNAKGAAAVLMEAGTGEILALASLPDFDPNKRPRPGPVQAESPIFNRAAQGVYEMGSTLKIFTAAMGMEAGLYAPATMIDTKGPLKWGKFKIRDFHDYGPRLSLRDVIVKSSNIGTSHVAVAVGEERQRDMLGKLGLFAAMQVELPEARQGVPLLPKKWSELTTMTVSYGHGLAVTPLHLASAYASVANGGLAVQPTLVRAPAGEARQAQRRVMSEATAAELRAMLRSVVTEGTATLADVPGYRVGGKTGTADKPSPTGGYHEDKVLATFAAIFPTDAPRYVLVVTLDEPEDRAGSEPRRTAGWTAAPVAKEIISRIAPLMNIPPSTK